MYENLIDPQIQILERCQVAWDNVANTSEDLSTYILGLNKADITKSFPMIIAKLKSIRAQSSEEASPFLIQTLSQSFTSWTAPLEGLIATSPENIPSIYSHLNAMWSQLNTFDNAPNIPNAKEIQRLVGEIKRLEGLAIGHVESIVGKEAESEGKRDAVLHQCNEILDKATDSLAAAARSGMAASFESRTKEYVWPRRFWLASFLVSLTGISVMAYCLIVPKLISLEGSDRLFHFLTELPLTFPFIWLAWFSALKFSQLGRLREDYAFKVATALSLDGYRKQAGDLSLELQERLLDLEIANFGENLLRLMTKESAKDAHPLAGAFYDKNHS